MVVAHIFLIIFWIYFLYSIAKGTKLLPSRKRRHPKLMPPEEVARLERELGITVENRLAIQYDDNEQFLQEIDRELNPEKYLRQKIAAQFTVPSHAMGDHWECGSCGTANSLHTNQHCWQCGGSFHGRDRSKTRVSGRPEMAWACTVCGYGNLGTRRHCYKCGDIQGAKALVQPLDEPYPVAVITPGEMVMPSVGKPRFKEVSRRILTQTYGAQQDAVMFVGDYRSPLHYLDPIQLQRDLQTYLGDGYHVMKVHITSVIVDYGATEYQYHAYVTYRLRDHPTCWTL